MNGTSMSFPVLVQEFFYQYLINQRGASRATVESYRDTFRLLLGFITDRSGIQPTDLHISDLDVELISAFLLHLEQDRGNAIRTRNARMSAIHSFMRYVAFH